MTAFSSADSGDTLMIEGTCVGALDIAKDITLSGTNSATLDGQGLAIRVVTVRTGATVTIDGLTISGGQGFAGVGIHNLGTVTLANSTVRDNAAAWWGGGIYNRLGATLTVVNSVILRNTAGENAGGIYNDGTLTFAASNVALNSGGLGGGGVFNSSFGLMAMSRGTLYGNDAQVGGGLANNGSLRIADSTIASNRANHGGGLYLGGGSAVVEGTTISDNQATANGGGVDSDGGIYWGGWRAPVFRNSTLVGNNAAGYGGGVANTGYIGGVTLDHLTLTGNQAASGAGIANLGYSGVVTLTGTVVAAPAAGQNCAGTITDGGYNLEDGMSCALDAASSLSSTDARLDPNGLAYNGGTTKSVALLPMSPGVDAIPQGSNGCGTSLTSDQRGVSRPQGSACDIGAIEVVPDTTPPVLDLPAAMTAAAEDLAGVVVTYSASATDLVDGSVPITCSPASGHRFAIGETTVSCAASDSAGNRADGSFVVHVKGAAEQVADLIALVDSYQLKKLGTSLHDKLESVERLLAAGKDRQAEEGLHSFISQVEAQRGKVLDEARADALARAAQRIIDVIDA